MKIRPVAAEFSHADRRTDLNDEPNSLFRNFAKAPNNKCCYRALLFEPYYCMVY